MNQSGQCELTCNQAYSAFQAGNLAGCRALVLSILATFPNHARTLFLQGVLYQESGQIPQAAEAISSAALNDPANAVYLNALGEVNQALGEKGQALECFQKSAELDPAYARVWNNLGLVQLESSQLDLAASSFQQAVNLKPAYALAWNNLGAVRLRQGKATDARGCFQNALRHSPGYPEAYFNLATCLRELGQPAEAAVCFKKAIDLCPGYDKAHFHLGLLLQKFRNDYQALDCFQKAVDLNPNNDEYARTLGDHLLVKKDWPAAIALLEKAFHLNSGSSKNLARLFHARQLVCNWESYQETVESIWHGCEKELALGQACPVAPFHSLTMPWTCQQLQQAARSLAKSYPCQPWKPGPGCTSTGRIKIGYVSGDFYDHAISHLLHGFFEKHDRTRFEVFVYSFSPPSDTLYRKRIEEGAERFIDVTGLAPSQMVEKIQSDGVQILVDLMGFTGVFRTEVFAQRSAPVQVSFLGMLGTMGAAFIDYLVADPHVIAPDMEEYFDEKLIRMPDSYLLAERIEPGEKTARSQHQLPEGAFVFCSFNNAYKIEPFTWDIWMEILREVQGSVLWLSSSGSLVEENLREEAARRGIARERILFAPFTTCAAHIEREAHANMFLDTFVYNAAATSSMALQAGLPVLTLQGKTFASRVGSSLLYAVGLQELVAHSPEEYLALAVDLAKRPGKLAALKKKLRKGLATAPLFDSSRFVKNLESAFARIWQRHANGLAPESFDVGPGVAG